MKLETSPKCFLIARSSLTDPTNLDLVQAAINAKTSSFRQIKYYFRVNPDRSDSYFRSSRIISYGEPLSEEGQRVICNLGLSLLQVLHCKNRLLVNTGGTDRGVIVFSCLDCTTRADITQTKVALCPEAAARYLYLAFSSAKT